jgi:hypothetical protein
MFRSDRAGGDFVTKWGWIAAGLITSGHAASAQQGPAGTILSFLHGSCVKLVIAGKDRSAECKPSLVNAAYPTGNSSFMFPVGDTAIVSFFGRDNAAVSDKSVIYLQRVTVRIGTEEDASSSDVQGTCTYTNPYVGPAQISCHADSPRGSYEAEFTSDGKAPESVKL